MQQALSRLRNMSVLMRIINRGESFDDSGCPNKWRWEWVSATVDVKIGAESGKERVGTRFRKVTTKGTARCILCDKDVSYAGRGLANLIDHLCTKKHLQNCAALKDNQRLAGTEPHDSAYGIDPVVKAVASKVYNAQSAPLTSVKDRVSNMEALTLAFAAEKGLSLSVVPDLIAFAKALSQDKTALKDLSMDRTTASYKLREGLAPFLQQSLLDELKTCPFSLNIDEATSKTNQKVLAVLVSHFSPSANKVVVNHLDAIVLTKATAEALFTALDSLFIKLELPWENLVSVLMDSCAVMRGSKGGLETLIRQKVPHLLDIDGDTCHHAHNAAKVFCKPFGGSTESLMSDLHTDFKYSAELKDKLFDLCQILGVKPTAPERYVPHRWLSVLDVALDTLRLFDAYTLFYYSFVRLEDRKLYADIIDDIMKKREVSQKGRDSVADIQLYLRSKFSNFTKDGKDRKARLLERCLENRVETLCTLHVYVSVLPSIKKYVLFFQQKGPAMHHLHGKQHELFCEFAANIMTPESLQKMPHKINIENEQNQKTDKRMFVPTKAVELLNKREGLSLKKPFLAKLRTAYIATALCLQKKMPVNNPVLKACAALDPAVRRTSTAECYLKSLVQKTSLIKPEQVQAFEKEVDMYTASPTIPPALPGTGVDTFWALVDVEKYPILTGVARKLLSAFHGPAVEASFSVMGEILHSGSSRMEISTYSALQTVRYYLASKGTTSIDFFQKKDPVVEPVPKELVQKMQKSWLCNDLRKEQNRKADTEKKAELGAPAGKPVCKTAEKLNILEAGEKDRENAISDTASRKRPATSQNTSQPEPKKCKTGESSQRSPKESTAMDTPAPKKIQRTLACFFKK